MIVMWMGGTGIAMLMLCGISNLPGFGRYPGPYGDIINSAAPFERQVTNVVAAVNFDYRALDTLGEEFILFGAVTGVLLLLRGSRGESLNASPETTPIGRAIETRSDAISWFSFVLVVFINLFGTYMVLHGNLTPGGGFQGGAILGTASMLVYVGTGYQAYRKTTPKKLVELVEAMAAGSYSLVGISAMIAGEAFLTNFLPLGTRGNLLSGGTIPLINFAVGVEVAAGFALVFTEFLEETRIDKSEDHP